MIFINKLTKRIGNSLVFNDLTLKFNTGNIYGIVGPNGVGKTTFLKCLVGLISADSGEIIVNDSIVDLNHRESVVKNISYLLSTELIQSLTGMENINLFAKLYGVDEEEINNLLKEFDLYEYKDKKVSKYSLGMKQRLALIVSLINKNRKIIILDEPYLGLDPLGIKKLNSKLMHYKDEGYLIIVSNHQLNESEKIFNEVIFFRKDKIFIRSQIKNYDKYSLNELFEKIFVEMEDFDDGFYSGECEIFSVN